MSESQVEPSGNTKTDGPGRAKQAVQCYQWCFTLRAESESQKIQPIQVWTILAEHCKKFGFQLEKGESGYEHYQGWFSLKTKERLSGVKNMFGLNQIHLEPLRDIFGSMNYCRKLDTRVAGPWSEGEKPLEPVITGDLFPWQQELLSDIRLGKLNRRKVIWYTDHEGNKGKSTFAVYLSRLRGEGVVRIPGRINRADAIYAIAERPDLKCVIFDIERDDFGQFDYGILAELKTGQIFCSKYKSRVVDFDPPVVVVFANSEPRLEKLSSDRWELRVI